MVNETYDIKTKVLKQLFEAGGKTVSGVRLSELAGVSRVAVWKHITALKESGFKIESGPKGYLLENPGDLLQPFCFAPDVQDRIFHFTELASTMDKARRLAKEDAPHLSFVIAENQTASRGRLNRQWFSSKGGLWFTIILKPQIPPVMAYIFNFAASLCLAQTLRSLYKLDVTVKWPNDLLLNGKKLVGVLSEMETRGDMVQFVNIGIGINVNNTPEKYEPKAVSIAGALDKTVSRRQILETFIPQFTQCIENPDAATIISQWKKMTSTIGTNVRIETLGDTFEGRAVDVDESGALIIETRATESGRLEKKKIIFGDCFHN